MGFGAVLGIWIGFYLSRPKRNQMMKLIPSDARGYDLDVIEENAFSVHCEPIETLPPQRFIKYRGSYTITQKRRLGRLQKITRWIGREGTAFTQRMESGIIKNIPLVQCLKTLWGTETYDNMPEELKDPIEKGKIGVTVQLENYEKPDGIKEISEENIKIEQDRQASKTLWEGKKEALKGTGIQYIAFIGLGVGIGLIACLMMGWIPIAKVT